MRSLDRSLAAITTVALCLLISTGAAATGGVVPDARWVTPADAENVELVKKVTEKKAPPQNSKRLKTAATGILGPTCTGERYAVIIGISDYPGSDSDLRFAVNDAEEVRSMLIERYGFAPENIRMLTDEAGTRAQIYEAVRDFAIEDAVGLDDELFFFYSGHGAKGTADDGDKSNQDVAIVVCNDGYTGFDYIWDGELKQLFANYPTDRIVFAFDSCLSGGMQVLAEPGRVVNMASTAKGLSYEGTAWGGGNGQFTYFFAIEGMQMQLAESTADSDDAVTVEEAFDYAKARCVRQTPTIADRFEQDLLP